MAKEKEYGMTFRPKFRSLQIVHGKDGKDGISPTIEAIPIENGHKLIITDKNGTDRVDILNGKDGKDGINGKDGFSPVKGVDYVDGYTPIKGVDYYTEAEKDAFVQDVINTLPTWNGGAY